MRYALGDKRVRTDGDDYWIAPDAQVIGDVTLKKGASVWFASVLRGDNEPITLGENSQIQDGCVIHTDPGFPVVIEDDASIGHKVMLHGCTVKTGALVGIGSIVLNGAVIGENCLIGANALITEGKVIPPNSVVMGAPGKVVREVTEKDLEVLAEIPRIYAERARYYRRHLKPDDD